MNRPRLAVVLALAALLAAPARVTRAMPRCVGSVLANNAYSTLSACTGAAQCHRVRSTA